MPPPRFLSGLRAVHLRDTSLDRRGTWQLVAPLVYSSMLVGLVRVPAKFVTDFASLPWWLPVGVLREAAPEAAVIHDWLYTVKTCERATADAVLREACAVCGMSWPRRWLMWAGPAIGGAAHWDADATAQPDEMIREAP